MTICFIANYGKTFFFHEIASRLKEKGVKVYWIVVNQNLSEFLTENYGAKAVLYLSLDDIKNVNDALGDYRLNELIYGDRALRYKINEAYEFLKNIQKPIYEFLKLHNINYLFGELTWAHEILIHRLVCEKKDLNAVYYYPSTIRMPAGRFAFFIDENESVLLEYKPNRISVDADTPVIKAEKPAYLGLNDLRLKKDSTLGARLARLKRYFTMENIDKKDPTLIANRWLTLKLKATEEINRELYKFVPKSKFDDMIQKNNYVFVGLHKQPEASIDVLGRYYEDQYLNIINIWRALPADWLLLIKEHSNAIGDRSWFFYRKLSKMRNVILVDEKTDSHQIIKKSRVVITVSGTIAYEAALMSIPSFTFSHVFFNRIKGCRRIGLDELRTNGIVQLIQSPDENNLNEYTDWIMHHSALGNISDPISDPECMSDVNIKQVADAFFGVIG